MRYVPNASEDFLAELDRNEPARNRFYALSQQEQQRIIEQARSVKDVYEMRALVNSIRACPYSPERSLTALFFCPF